MAKKEMKLSIFALVIVVFAYFDVQGFVATRMAKRRSSSGGAPSALALSASSNYRYFWVSWAAGSGNGNCKLQYQNSSGTYVDVESPLTLNCDASQSSTQIALSSGSSPWSGSTPKSVRIVRISDSSVLGTFPQQLTCSPGGSSATSTPDTDEDCNTGWDDYVCTSYSGCPSGSYCADHTVYNETTCNTVDFHMGVGCVGTWATPGTCISGHIYNNASGCGYEDVPCVYY